MVKISGATLIELLMVMALIVILGTLSVSGLNYFLNSQRSFEATHVLYSALTEAHQLALTRHDTVVLCPLDKKEVCTNNWNQKITMFIDSDANRIVFKKADKITTLIPAKTGTLKWAGFPSSRYVAFLPQATHSSSQGSFIYCPQSNNALLARVIIISRMGRVRFAEDADNNGVVETANGQSVYC